MHETGPACKRPGWTATSARFTAYLVCVLVRVRARVRLGGETIPRVGRRRPGSNPTAGCRQAGPRWNISVERDESVALYLSRAVLLRSAGYRAYTLMLGAYVLFIAIQYLHSLYVFTCVQAVQRSKS